MSINSDLHSLAMQLDSILPPADIIGIYLPQPIADETFRDEFGFIFLADGSVGPFYVSMGKLLQTLWQRFPQPMSEKLPRGRLLDGFNSMELVDRALAIGTYNALSRSLMHRVGYKPPKRNKEKENHNLHSGDRVAVVGYFCPVVDRLLENGISVLVLEQAPQRLEARKDVDVTTDPADLAGCKQVICTASTLINNTIDELLKAASDTHSFQLIGPTGSGLPDALFDHGVTAVGGIEFSDASALRQCLGAQDSWGKTGRKYEITPENYPGADQLMKKLD